MASVAGWRVAHVPSEEAEDQRQLHRDLATLKQERARTTTRIKGLLSSPGVRLPHLTKLPEQLDTLRLWDSSPLPSGLPRRVLRVYAHHQFLSAQIAALEAERRALLQSSQEAHIEQVRQLMPLRGSGINGAWLLVMAFFGWRELKNRREVGGLAGCLWRTGRAAGTAPWRGLWRRRRASYPDRQALRQRHRLFPACHPLSSGLLPRSARTAAALYCPGAVALERLEVNADGDLLDTCTPPWSDGTTGSTRSPLELLEQRAARVPLPRQPQVRDGGCLAPHRHLRATILPTPRQPGREAPADRSPSPPWTWARLLQRVCALAMARGPGCQQGRRRIIAAITAGNVIQTMLRHLQRAVNPPSIAPARQAACAWDGSSPSRALRADGRPLQSVFLRLVPRLSVSGNTVLRVQLPRPLAAEDDLPAPASMCDPSPQTNDLTSGRFASSLDFRLLRLLQGGLE